MHDAVAGGPAAAGSRKSDVSKNGVYHQYIKKWQSESREKVMNNGRHDRHAKIVII